RDRVALRGRGRQPADDDPLEGRVRGAGARDRRVRDGRPRDREHRGEKRMNWTLIAVVAVALFFDFTNGFHDAANAIATSVSTRALSPRIAVLMAAVL